MAKNLLIVESPAKAKTIENYLGKDYTVLSSYGHVRDLSKEEMGVDIKSNFAPRYVIIEEKKRVIASLKKSSKQASCVYLATDDDREGEAISWHLAEALGLKDPKRIVFQEITKKAIQEAVARPRDLNMGLVEAQQARRILDRIVGFEISPVLWQKIRSGLSAGRVQSVAVRLVVERERSIKSFETSNFFSVKADLKDNKEQSLQARLSAKLAKEEEAKDFLFRCSKSRFSVAEVEKKRVKRNPSPPFTTSTLQQEASRLLSLPVAKTMRLAQQLYEAGHISYMRTDSVHLSEEALSSASSTIHTQFGAQYSNTRQYKTKVRSAQEAHEAIRPTNFAQSSVPDTKGEGRLYDLIWRRALASQMSSAEIDRTLLHIAISDNKEQLLATGDVLHFDGFLRLYTDEKEDSQTQQLPDLQVGDELNLLYMSATEGFTRPSPRYTEATLVRELEEKGIGRPSTYAPIIETIQKRNYVIKESREGTPRDSIQWVLEASELKRNILTAQTGAEKNKLFPTDTGITVNDFLKEHFIDIMDYSFTADIEEKLDKIANGKGQWQQMLSHFYDQFHPQVDKTKQLDHQQISKQRVLGKDLKTGQDIFVLTGKYGPYVQLGELVEGEDKPPRASLRKGQLMEDIKLEEALDLLKLPRNLGTYEESPVVTNLGRFGPYVQHNKKFYSLGEEQDPLTIDLPAAIDLIETARQVEKNRIIKTFSEDPLVQVLNGRYGPYIKFGSKNVRIPKNQAPDSLTYKDCVALAEKKPSTKGKRS